MRTLRIVKVLLIFFITSLAFVSCENQIEDLNDLKNKEMPVDAFFEKVSSMDLKVSDENVIYISFSYNKEKNTIKYFESLEREPHLFLIIRSEDLKKRQGPVPGAREYDLICSMGGDGSNDWTKKCRGKYACAKLASGCLDDGGCASICEAQMIYLPQLEEFVILSEEEFIDF